MSTVEFLGVKTDADLIDSLMLASAVGLTAGDDQEHEDAWLHFNVDGKELYVSMKPMRRGVSWNELNELGLVFGEKTIVLDGQTYKVRLLKGINGTPRSMGGSYDPKWAEGSEWNRLMYPIHWGEHIDPNNDPAKVGESVKGDFLGFTDTDLGIHHRVIKGSRSWCQEQYKGLAIQRGMFGVSYSTKYDPRRGFDTFGWRPVLEKVESA